jgi:hypothetical protein
MNWNEIVDKVTPYIVKIETPTGYGTGFLCMYNTTRGMCGIATAYHVIQDTDTWQQPMRVYHHQKSKMVFLKEEERIVLTDALTDSAVILAPAREFEFPKDVIQLRPIDDALPIGVEVGWLGFPALVPDTLSFFSGNISARQENRKAYLIDGVAINGVSGGPVVYSTPTEGVQIVGIISAYMANRARGDALPGLSFAQDVSHFHSVTKELKDFDEARRKQLEQKNNWQINKLKLRLLPLKLNLKTRNRRPNRYQAPCQNSGRSISN